MNKIIKVGALAICIGCVIFAVSLYDNTPNGEETIEEPVLGEEVILRPVEPIEFIGTITRPSNVPFKALSKIQQNTLIGQMKSKTLKNGKIIPNSLTEEENNLLMEMISEKYEGVQINDLPVDAFGISEITGKTILKLEYLINNL